MQCKHVKGVTTVPKVISAANKDDFKLQYKELLQHAKSPEGIVYVWRSVADIPRVRGASPIIYIGKANGSLYQRYIDQISNESKEYWSRFNHIIKTYGSISIDIYETDNPAYTENIFLYQYHQKCMELPPINLQSYKAGML